MAQTNQYFQQSEKVRKQMPLWMTLNWNVATDFIKRGEVEQIGERDYRVPFETQVGGRVGKYDPQLGDMGRGTALKGGVMISTYFNLRMNFELDMLSIKATQDKSLAIKNPFKDAIKSGMKEFMLYIDKFFHSDGTAVLGTAIAHSSASGVSVYTMDNIFGVQRLRRGMYLSVYNNGLTVQNTNGTLFINAMDSIARTVTLSGIVPGASATDKLCFEGVSGTSPAGLKGLYYFNSSASSGTTLSVNRATEPEMIANSVNAAGGLTHEHGMALYHRILNRRGEVANNILGLAAPAQQAAVYSNVMSIQNYNIAGGNVSAVDRLPGLKGKKSFMFADIPHYVDIHQDATRLDYIVPDTWGRARLDEMKFFETPGSNERFFPLYGGSGGPAAGVWFGLTCDEDFYCVNPGSNGLIYGLTIPTLYA